MSFDEIYSKGVEVGWSGLSHQEHAILLYHQVTERDIENQRNKETSNVLADTDANTA